MQREALAVAVRNTPQDSGVVLTATSYFLQHCEHPAVVEDRRRFHRRAYLGKQALTVAIANLEGRLLEAIRCPTSIGRVVLIQHVGLNHWVRCHNLCRNWAHE